MVEQGTVVIVGIIAFVAGGGLTYLYLKHKNKVI